MVVGLTLPGFSLHDAHGPPFDETISSIPYGVRASLRSSDAPRPIACSRLLGVAQSLECEDLPLTLIAGPTSTIQRAAETADRPLGLPRPAQ